MSDLRSGEPHSGFLDPMPRQDVQLPPPIGFVPRADYDAQAAEIARLRAQVEAADGLWEALDEAEMSCLGGDFQRVFAAFNLYQQKREGGE